MVFQQLDLKAMVCHETPGQFELDSWSWLQCYSYQPAYVDLSHKCTMYIRLLLLRSLDSQKILASHFPTSHHFLCTETSLHRSKSQESHPPAANLRGDHWTRETFDNSNFGEHRNTKHSSRKRFSMIYRSQRFFWCLHQTETGATAVSKKTLDPFGRWNLTVEQCPVSTLIDLYIHILCICIQDSNGLHTMYTHHASACHDMMSYVQSSFAGGIELAMCVLESFCQRCWDAQESMTLNFIH